MLQIAQLEQNGPRTSLGDPNSCPGPIERMQEAVRRALDFQIKRIFGSIISALR